MSNFIKRQQTTSSHRLEEGFDLDDLSELRQSESSGSIISYNSKETVSQRKDSNMQESPNPF